MDSFALYLLSLLPGLILPLIAGPLAGVAFIALAKRNRPQSLIIFCLALSLLTVAASIFMAYNYGNFFPGPGAVLCVLSPLVGGGTFIFLRRAARRARIENDTSTRRRLLIGALLIPFLQIATPFLGMGYSAVCDRIHAVQSRPIVAALDAYQHDQGSYPESLDSLVPNYIAALPTPSCFAPLRALGLSDAEKKKFDLLQCFDPAVTLLTAPNVLNGNAVQRYNLSTGNWSVMDTFEGLCSFLK